MDYGMQGSKDAYSSQVHNLYPHAQPELYPPGGYQYYQGYLGGAEQPPYGQAWSGQASPYDAGPLHYQDDADCITFLRGCLAGLCCCWLLGRCCV
ncbi:unnamed protein product [Urochloa decumbens]|uniref:Cysteine-rich transmembrane CYSTM domain-containing protein n=1 Tax=Urochloa decumbens TaxID=240449 RepID=A0ABC9CXP6_9POAL